jgi:hypothetical protein
MAPGELPDDEQDPNLDQERANEPVIGVGNHGPRGASQPRVNESPAPGAYKRTGDLAQPRDCVTLAFLVRENIDRRIAIGGRVETRVSRTLTNDVTQLARANEVRDLGGVATDCLAHCPHRLPFSCWTSLASAAWQFSFRSRALLLRNP